MTLYELTDELAAVLEAGEDGELPEDLEARLDDLLPQFDQKVDNICRLMAEISARAEGRINEAERLTALGRAGLRTVGRLKSYLKDSLERMGVKKIETPLFKVRVQNNSQPSIEYTGDVSQLPPTFRRTIIEPDKKAVLTAWKAGEELPPGFVVEVGQHLRVE